LSPQDPTAPAPAKKSPPPVAPPAPEPPAPEPRDPAGIVATRFAQRYYVVSHVGQTSAAWVYRAIHTGLGVPCFLKIADVEPAAEGGIPERLRREARAAATVRHPALLRALDAGVADGFAYLAQEWTDGATLRSVIALGAAVSVTDLLAIAIELLEVLEAIHRRGIVLRALEPERIFVHEKNGRREPKLFDLSRAHFAGDGGGPPVAERTRRGLAGIVVQSARYLSPEEIREAEPDPRSDLYSFGLLLYELLTGEFPYAERGGGATSYLVSHLREIPRPLALPPERGRVPEDLPGIIRRLLAKKPEDRFESAEAARRAIEDVVVPDLIRYATPGGQRVLEAWRKRVRSGCARTAEQPASKDE
jgi:serine/threonine-protein kinase